MIGMNAIETWLNDTMNNQLGHDNSSRNLDKKLLLIDPRLSLRVNKKACHILTHRDSDLLNRLLIINSFLVIFLHSDQ
jgi:hypothetical protein